MNVRPLTTALVASVFFLTPAVVDPAAVLVGFALVAAGLIAPPEARLGLSASPDARFGLRTLPLPLALADDIGRRREGDRSISQTNTDAVEGATVCAGARCGCVRGSGWGLAADGWAIATDSDSDTGDE